MVLPASSSNLRSPGTQFHPPRPRRLDFAALLAHDSLRWQKVLQNLRQPGCRIALDDSCTKCSSPSCITRFRPDRIKIGKALVQNVDLSTSDAAMAGAVLPPAANLGLTGTTEGGERAGGAG
jgi:EAL domain-containing protein (putative c-di-GMP-specific phosphodiesterase class I)